MRGANDQKRPSIFCEDFFLHHLDEMSVSPEQHATPLFVRLDLAPINRRIAQQDTQPLSFRRRLIYIADRFEELFIDWRIENDWIGMVAPDLANFGKRDIFAGNIAV